MASDKLIGPALHPMHKKEEDDEDSENETRCKAETNIGYFRIWTTSCIVLTHDDAGIIFSG